MDFFNYLKNVKGYSLLTCELYSKYAKELIKNNLCYKSVLDKHQNTSNNTKRVIISAFKKYLMFIDDKRYLELELPKKSFKITKYISWNDYEQLKKFLIFKKKNELFLLIRILYETGIRVSELLNIKIKDIELNKIKINGKNNKQRYVYLNKSLNKLLINYIQSKKVNDNDFLFKYKYKNLHKKISNLGLKVLNRKISCHMFRRGFATYCSINNVDIFSLCQLMGHENINTTKMYIKKDVNIDYVNIFN